MSTLQQLRKACLDAEKQYHQGIADTFRGGMIVHVEQYPDMPVQVNYTSRDRVLVYNPKTEKTYWVGAYRLREYPKQ